MKGVNKIYKGTMCGGNFYKYEIYEVNAGRLSWLEAVPMGKGVTRCADSVNEMQILLDNDAININRFQQRIK